MKALADFLNHGILPFAGRERELERILEVWERSPESGEGMRVLLVTGEAGVGKSRLLHEAIVRIESARGVVVHLKLYPESTVALGPMAAQALGRSRNGRPLLRGEPEESIGSVVESLRRFARLRPTALVIEDIHLLSGDGLREFTQLLEAIGDESMALICLARPVEYPARGVLERWALEEMELEGLSEAEIASMWCSLFNGPPSAEELDTLRTSTLGNALALRSALRGALRQGALEQRTDGGWSTKKSFAGVAARSATSLTEGMTAHLNDEDREAAHRLALLGEVFSREAALALVEPSAIEGLLFSGVIHEMTLPRPPLPGAQPGDAPPLAFTHSLVHRQLVEQGELPLGALIEIIAAGLPLYSILPFELIAREAERDSTALDDLSIEALRRAMAVAQAQALALDATPDWPYAATAQAAAEALVERSAGRWNDEELRMARTGNLARKLSLMRRRMFAPEFLAEIERLLELTEGVDVVEIGSLRMLAYIALARHRYILEDYDGAIAVRKEIAELLAQIPSLLGHRQYVICLQCFAQIAAEHDDDPLRREIEREHEAFMAQDALSEDLRLLADSQILPHLLTLFDSREELEKRFDMYESLLKIADHPSPYAQYLHRSFLPSRPYFLRHVGQVDALLKLIDDELPHLVEQGTQFVYYRFLVFRMWGRALLAPNGEELEGALREVERAHTELQGTRSSFTPDAQWAVEAALIRGEIDMARTLIERYAIDGETLPNSWRRLLGIPAAEATTFDITAPILRPWDLISLRAGLASLDNNAATRSALTGALEWLGERRLNTIIDSLLRDFETLLDQKTVAAWRKRSGQIAGERKAMQRNEPTDQRLRLSMLGRIEVQPGDGGEPLQPRGARQKALLGALVAAEMLTKPLDRSEFFEAVGIEDVDDPKLARDALNSALYRVRDIIGREGIVAATGDEAPRLNREAITVDLLEANDLLREADEDMRRDAVGRAGVAVRKALEITRGDVPFPALYDTFFEALREDFENRLRSTTLLVARRLLREADGAGAEEMLERAFAITPDDEEIAELYRESLELQGRRIEAQRVRRKVEVV